ncbi:hypothetical protein AAF712_015542 [Marasmius tenuissimus]|uniref:HMG domain-containing protein n=1 Tax=Marasmius tenuissimus TaxID=585030 RepID=A0ABR2Z996_9AGAR
MTTTPFDNIFEHEDVAEGSNNTDVWKGIGDLHDHSSEARGVEDVWSTWNRNVDRDESEVPMGESPMKKRRTRRGRAEGGRRSGTTKRMHREPTSPVETEQATVAFTTDVEHFVDCGLDENIVAHINYDEGTGEESTHDDGLEVYMELFQEGEVGFIPVGTYLFAVQGWDKKNREPTSRWYHFEAKRVGDDVQIVCFCPQAKEKEACVHRETYLEFRDEEFRDLENRVFLSVRVVWFWRVLEDNTPEEGQIWMNRFSVGLGQEGMVIVNKRAIVSFLGSDTGAGVWTCSECSGGKCAHRTAARRIFGQVMGTEDLGGSVDRVTPELEEEEDVVMFADRHGGRLDDVSISYLPVRPPAWAELPDDHPHYPGPTNSENPLSLIPLSAQNRSPCGRKDCMVNDITKEVRTCTVYTLNQSYRAEIELLPCSACPPCKHCFVGPDPRDLGLFNFNNSVLFTHDILDEYTSQYTSSETLFVAFVETTTRRYERMGSKFVKEDLFRSVWFAFVRIQDFSNDMTCKRCGQEPDCLIWDGVTLGFGRKHLTDSLRPPTYTDSLSLQRQRGYPQKPQLLTDEAQLRRLIRRWVKNGKKGGKQREDHEMGSKDGRQPEDAWNMREEFRTIVGHLARVSKDLALLFSNALSGKADLSLVLRQAYMSLFEQIAADESALQMVGVRCLPVLEDFVQRPTWEMGSRLVDIPALYNVLELEFRLNGKYPEEVVKVASWMLERTRAVWANTCRHNRQVVDDPAIEEQSAAAWMQVSMN